MTREDINDIINAICPNDEDYEKPCISPKYLRQELEQLALDQKQWNGEPTTKNDLVVDCVSRQEVDRLACRYLKEPTDNHVAFYEDFLELPSVTPIRPKGHWIETAEEYYKAVNKKGGGVNENTDFFTDDIACSECLAKFSVIDNEAERFDYCPCCGSYNKQE